MLAKPEVSALLRALYPDLLPDHLDAVEGLERLPPALVDSKVRTGHCLVALIEMTMRRNKNTLKYVFVDLARARKLASSSDKEAVGALVRLCADGIGTLFNADLAVDETSGATTEEAVASILARIAPRMNLECEAGPAEERDITVSKVSEVHSRMRNNSQVTNNGRNGKTGDNGSVSIAAAQKSAIDLVSGLISATFKLNKKAVE